MTIAFGVRCEDGVVMVTDSMTQRVRPGGWIEADLEGRKIGTLHHRLRFVVSGLLPAGYEPDPRWEGLEVPAVAQAMLAELQFLEPPAERWPGGQRRPTDLLIAGTLTWEPQLLLVGTDREPQEAAVGGPPLVGGAMAAWAATTGISWPSGPPRVRQAVEFALECCRRYLRASWAAWGVTYPRVQDFHMTEPGGGVPPSAPPFHISILRPGSVEEIEVPE